MNIHQNARLTFARRLEMVQDVIEHKLTHAAAAAKHHVSVPTVRKWVGRYINQGESGLRDASSRPQRSPRAIAPQLALAIVELRRRFLTHARIAQSLGVSASTVGRVLARAGLSRWADLAPSEPSLRYEHAHPGDMLHIDTKKLGLQHSFTRPYRPQTNGKAERFIQSALREWAYGIPYQRSAERSVMLQRWTHHYNWHRPHQGIGGIAPMSRLNQTRNNLLTLHT